jgi:hypothetical protein
LPNQQEYERMTDGYAWPSLSTSFGEQYEL